MRRIFIIIPSVWSGVYLSTARLLKYSLEDIGIEAIIGEVEDQPESILTIILGWNLIRNPENIKSPYILYQLEPLLLPFWQDRLQQQIQLFHNALDIWDYAEPNIKYLQKIGFNAKWVPIGYHTKLEESCNTEYPDYDVVFVGFLSERRLNILEKLQQHCCVSIQPRWGKDYSEALSRTKIVLNIHQFDFPTPLEQPRISYALNNRCFIITENSIDQPFPQLVQCDISKIIDTTLFYLFNKSQRQQIKLEVFEAFKLQKFRAIEMILESSKAF